MNGPEHYRRAEALLDSCQVATLLDIDDEGRAVEHYPVTEWDVDGEREEDTVSASLAAAQVHATLALAAAQVEAAYVTATNGHDGAIRTDWVEAIR